MNASDFDPGTHICLSQSLVVSKSVLYAEHKLSCYFHFIQQQ